MTKGNAGVNLSLFAILAFIMTFLNLYIPLFLILGFVLIVEKNIWLTKQTLYAVFVRILFTAVTILVNAGRNVIVSFLGLFNSGFTFGAINFFNSAANFVNGLFNVILLAFCIYAVLTVAKEKDVKFPGLNKIVDKAIA